MTLQSPTATLIPLCSSSELTGCGYPGLMDRKNRSDMCPRWESKPRLPACKANTLSTRPGSPLLTILFYPITLEGRRGTTDEFATIPFHLDLFSAALVELVKSIPVHSLILSSHLFFCLPLFFFFFFFFIVPCRIVFAKQEDLETSPNHLSFRILTRVRSSTYSPNAWIFLRTSSLVTWSLYEMFNSLR